MAEWAIAIDGTAAGVLDGTPTFDLALQGGGDVATFVVVAASTDVLPRIGASVTMTNPDSTLIFGGTIIRRAVRSADRAPLAAGATRLVTCECRGHRMIASRRLIWYTATDANTDDIADALVDYVNAYSAEGLTKTGIVRSVLVEGDLFFDGVYLSEALDFLAQRIDGGIWGISAAKDVFLKIRTATSAPFNLSSGAAAARNLSVEQTLERYRNVQWVLGAQIGQGPEVVETLTAAASQGYLETRYPIHVLNSMTKNGSAQTVGREGNPADVGKVGLYEQGSRVIRLTSAGAVNDVFEVKYNPERRAIGYAEDQDGTALYSRWEHVHVDEQLSTDAQAQAVADGLLRRYGLVTRCSFETDTHGFLPGQTMTINLSPYGVNDTFVVEQVSFAKDDMAGPSRYRIVASSGLPQDTDEDFLRRLILRDVAFTAGEGERLDRFEARQDNCIASSNAVVALV